MPYPNVARWLRVFYLVGFPAMAMCFGLGFPGKRFALICAGLVLMVTSVYARCTYHDYDSDDELNEHFATLMSDNQRLVKAICWIVGLLAPAGLLGYLWSDVYYTAADIGIAVAITAALVISAVNVYDLPRRALVARLQRVRSQ